MHSRSIGQRCCEAEPKCFTAWLGVHHYDDLSHFVIAVWRVKEAESAPGEVLENRTVNFRSAVGVTRAG
jgi:hypothetical protein